MKSRFGWGLRWRRDARFRAFPAAAAAAKSIQSCPTLCDPMHCSLPGSPVPGVLQARTLEWVAISFSNAQKWKVKVKLLSRARLLATPCTAAYQAPPSMGFSRQEYWSGVPLPYPERFLGKFKKFLGTWNWWQRYNFTELFLETYLKSTIITRPFTTYWQLALRFWKFFLI